MATTSSRQEESCRVDRCHADAGAPGPGVAGVPVAHTAGILRQRRGGRGDRCSRGRVGQQALGQQAAHCDVTIRKAVVDLRGPRPPTCLVLDDQAPGRAGIDVDERFALGHGQNHRATDQGKRVIDDGSTWFDRQFRRCELREPPTTAVGVALDAITLLSQQQLIGEVARYAGPARLRVLPPLCPLAVSAADFSHADELIARARKATGSWLDEGGPDLPKPERFLSMHDHNSPRSLLRGHKRSGLYVGDHKR